MEAPMIVLGLIGRPDSLWCHDAAACLIVDGQVIGALEQERVSRRRYAPNEGPEGAVRALLAAYGLHPSEIQAIGYAWDEPSASALEYGTDIPGGVQVSDQLTETILPTLGSELGTREIFFFDHHLCHAAQAYFLNTCDTADILVIDSSGGAGSTSLFHADQGKFRLLERYDNRWSLGAFYQAASAYATLTWQGAGKLMGLSSYGRPSGRRFMTFNPEKGGFQLEGRLRGAVTGDLNGEWVGAAWLKTFEASVFPYTPSSANTFDYAPFAADVQTTLEELGLGLTARLRRVSGEDTLLLSGGVMLNAHMNRRIARESGYQRVSGTVAPNDGGTAFGAAMLAESLIGTIPRPLPGDDAQPIFFGPAVATEAIETALNQHGIAAQTMEPDRLRSQVAVALARGKVVAWFDGPNEFGPRALGARSLLASPADRTMLDRLNRIKGREPWRPAALSLTAAGFRSLDMEPPVRGLSDYMLCMHRIGESYSHRAVAGVHVDGTSRAQYVQDDADGFGALLAAVGDESGFPGVINTSLNTRGQPMVLTPGQAVELMAGTPDIDVLAMPPYLVRRC
jgi:carbamoyltransferase